MGTPEKHRTLVGFAIFLAQLGEYSDLFFYSSLSSPAVAMFSVSRQTLNPISLRSVVE
jgi:hypothetical protein